MRERIKKEILCINCPMGCVITAEGEDGKLTAAQGNACKRGLSYAENELFRPARMVTALCRVAGRQMPLSVKTSAPVPKALVLPVVEAIKKTDVQPPVHLGDKILYNVLGSGADVVATKEIL